MNKCLGCLFTPNQQSQKNSNFCSDYCEDNFRDIVSDGMDNWEDRG